MVAADDNEKKKKGDAEKIQGKWIVVEVYESGSKKDGDSLGDVITFLGKNKMTWTTKVDNRESIWFFELRPDKKPKELNLKLHVRLLPADQKELQKELKELNIKDGRIAFPIPMIYELSGDTLKICISAFEDRKPIAADDKRSLMVLKRDKGDDKKKP